MRKFIVDQSAVTQIKLLLRRTLVQVNGEWAMGEGE